MTSAKDRRLRSTAITAGVVASLLLSSCQPCAPIWGPGYPDMGSGCAEGESCGINGKRDTERTFKAVAHEIDELEKHIEKYGSIVAKHADVWGQARLMMYRQQIERELRIDMQAFPANTLQATIATSDQAFLASAFGLQAALGAGAAGVRAPDVTNMVSGNDIIQRDKLLYTTASSPLANGKLVIEPSLLEDQKKRFLDHLTELRRMNEGDDNTDAPGYALHLVRIPVSVLTGDCTQTGYGAECAITATPHLSDDLLPQTFRDLVVNDLTGLLTLTLTRIIGTTKEEDLRKLLDDYEKAEAFGQRNQPRIMRHEQLKRDRGAEAETSEAKDDELENKYYKPRRELYAEVEKKISNSNPASPRRVNQTPLPTSQLSAVVGAHNLAYLAQHVRKQIKDHLACKGAPYHLDVQAVLRNELGAAYEFLSTPNTQHLWRHCTPELAQAIRTQDVETKIAIQKVFFHTDIDHLSSTTDYTWAGLPISRTMTSILAWMIIVDSALLNQRFLEEMQATHAAKGCPCVPPGWLPLFLPHPPPEVCQFFNDYVRCRWPLHIFAIDPETEDQNVGDSFRLRREMQLALSLAFAGGQIGANSFTRYTRRIEQDIDTISINRTIIGFSHGDNTFGWRFYPRVQTPPINGNLQAIFRDLLIGGQGPGYMLRRRRLENGTRECVALVIMPSFVPSVDLEITGNWFRLDHPKCKELTLKQVLRLSAAVQSIQNHGGSACDQDRYRPGDSALALRRLDQLSERLPLQHQLVSVPFENTHGGFELLSAGTTDLGPELIGWYGAPGINPNGDTTLFLVGNNFSVHQTRVVVGGRMLDSICTVDCAKNSSPNACDCKSAASGAAPSAPSGQPTGAAPTTTATPGAAATPSTTPTCTGEPVPDEDVQQVARFRLRHKLPAATNITTVVPPPPTPMAVTTTTTHAAAVAPPGTTGSTTTNTPPATGSPGTTGSTTTAAGSPGTTGSTTTTTPSGTAGSTATTTPSGTTGSTTTTTIAPAAAPTVTNPAAPPATPPVPVFQVELLSRQVMRVVIPKGVYSKDGMVDVHIATPYGVSPALQIPIICPTPPPPPPPPPPPAYGYSMPDANPKVTIPYGFVPGPGGTFKLALVGPPQGTLRFNWKEPTGMALKLVNAAVTFKVGDNAQVIAWVRLMGKNGYYEVADNESGKCLSAFCMGLLDGLNQLHQFAPDKPLPASLDSAQIEITPVSAAVPHGAPPAGLPPPWMPPATAAPKALPGTLPPLRPVLSADAPAQNLHSPRTLPPPPRGVCPPPAPPLPAHDVQPVQVSGKITVQFQRVAVGCVPGN